MSRTPSEYDKFVAIGKGPRTLESAAARFDGITSTETPNVIRFLYALATVHEMKTGDAMCIRD